MNYTNVRNKKQERIKALETENGNLKQQLIEKELKIIELSRELEKAAENAKPRK